VCSYHVTSYVTLRYRQHTTADSATTQSTQMTVSVTAHQSPERNCVHALTISRQAAVHISTSSSRAAITTRFVRAVGLPSDFTHTTHLLAYRLGRWTYDQKVVGSTPGQVAVKWLSYG